MEFEGGERKGRKKRGWEGGERETLWGGKNQDRRRKEGLLLHNTLTIIIEHSKTQIITAVHESVSTIHSHKLEGEYLVILDNLVLYRLQHCTACLTSHVSGGEGETECIDLKVSCGIAGVCIS